VPGGQVVRRRPLAPLFVGSNPTRAAKKESLIMGDFFFYFLYNIIMILLPREFYDKDTVIVAQELLGAFFTHTTKEGETGGRIVETEAYLTNDPANHAFGRVTKRTHVMYGKPGCAYIYTIYGMYCCMNVVTREEGIGEAVLIRSLQPITGISLMQHRRGKTDVSQLCNGPGKLTIAMGITPALDGLDVTNGDLTISKDLQETINRDSIVATPRIGVTKAQDLLLRFCLNE
jgi:DNA-3-methyladenine glycosylase